MAVYSGLFGWLGVPSGFGILYYSGTLCGSGIPCCFGVHFGSGICSSWGMVLPYDVAVLTLSLWLASSMDS